MVLADILGVVKLVPLTKELPPEEAEYQLIVPAEAVAPNVTVPTSQRAAGVVAVIAGLVLIVAIIDVLEEVVQPLLVAST